MSEENNTEDFVVLIKWKEATHLINAYNKLGKGKLVTTVDVAGNPTEVPLSGFSIDKTELDSLFHDPDVKRIFVAIGYHDGSIRANESTGHSGIFFGMDSNDILKITSSNTIINYSSPCPKRCPKDSSGVPIDLGNIQPLPLLP